MKSIVALTLVSFVAAPVPKAGPVPDARESFQGEWKFVQCTKEGKSEGRDSLDEAKVSVKGDFMAITFQGTDEWCSFVLNSKVDPCTIDLMCIPSNAAPTHLTGIYKLEKDKLTICLISVGKGDRPKEFKSDKGSDAILLILERVKK